MDEVLLRIASCALCLAFFFAASVKCLGVLQQSGYQNKGFFKWLKRKDNLYFNRLALLSGLLFLSCAVTSLTFSFMGVKTGNALSAFPFVFFCGLFLYADGKYALKVPLKITGRVKRLAYVYVFILACVLYIFIAVLQWLNTVVDSEIYGVFAYLPLCFAPMLLPFLLGLSNAAVSPFEKKRNQKFVQNAKEKLKKTEIVRVGIVGSYGKTSVKNIVKTILGEKVAVVCTPESYNTPIGIAKTVFSPEFENKQIFIAEMGARKEGDIAELCEIVEPDYAVFTGVCAQHIQSIGSVEKVFQAKSEIFRFVKNFAVCGESVQERVEQLSEQDKKKCVFLSKERVKGVVLGATQTEFTLCLAGGEIAVKTKLLGEAAVENIALSALLCEKMGLTVEEIGRGIEKIQPIPHRLEVVESGGAYILDDAYNANPEGAKHAVAALKRFAGKKIVVTPGIVEAGILEEEVNGALGALLVDLDEIVLVGDTLIGAVKAGYLAAGGNAEKLTIVPTLNAAEEKLAELLGEGDAVLFLNDLPDAY